MTRPTKNYYCYSWSCGTSFSGSFHCYKEGEIPTRKGKYTVVTTIMKPQQLIKHIKISYFLASLVFCKYLCFTYWNGLNQGTSKLRHSKYLKKYKPCYFYTFCQEYILQYTFAQSVVPQKFICVPKIIDFQFQCTMTDCEFKIWH